MRTSLCSGTWCYLVLCCVLQLLSVASAQVTVTPLPIPNAPLVCSANPQLMDVGFASSGTQQNHIAYWSRDDTSDTSWDLRYISPGGVAQILETITPVVPRGTVIPFCVDLALGPNGRVAVVYGWGYITDVAPLGDPPDFGDQGFVFRCQEFSGGSWVNAGFNVINTTPHTNYPGVTGPRLARVGVDYYSSGTIVSAIAYSEIMNDEWAQDGAWCHEPRRPST